MNGAPLDELKEGKRVPAPAPVGVAHALPHPFEAFSDAINRHMWRRAALDMYESHQFIGRPYEVRYCSRCTLQLPGDWKDPKKALPPSCGDPRIKPVPAMYEYVDGNPVNGIRLANPKNQGAKLAQDKEPDACT